MLIVLLIAGAIFWYIAKTNNENKVLRQVIERLTADSRVAEVAVTDQRKDPSTKKTYTTIKFQEYDTNYKLLDPQYFVFSGNIIQFQSMVIRFDDYYVKKGDPLRGKSAYFFTRVFMLTDKGAEVYDINKVNEVPSGYEINGSGGSAFERKLWRKFWKYALNPKEAKRVGIKNAQIEAPGTMFIPGMQYILKIEHDGGLRIDSRLMPAKAKGKVHR
ncbi:MAG: hypothetical protein NTY47_05590 [Candidatus Omnitrophica bacterium]|nr:hypothetical protein [Candidatus Omnitrophota bacterium]